MSDLFDERTAMRVIHSYLSWHLFDEDSAAVVVKKWRSRSKETAGQILEERGGLDGEHMSKECKAEMAKAWAEYSSWNEANA